MGNLIAKLSNVLGSTKLSYHVAKGIVYFNAQGEMVETILRNNSFEAWVEICIKTGSCNGKTKIYKGKKYEMAIMPKIIQNKETSSRNKVYYQQFDHEIAAFTLIYNRCLEYDRKVLENKRIFNLSKEKSLFVLPIANTAGLFFVGGGQYTNLPMSLDSTLVKAICMRESRCDIGRNTSDIMQVNNTGDWAKEKIAIGLTQGASIKHNESIKSGIFWLHSKGSIVNRYYIKGLDWDAKNKGWNYSGSKIENITKEQGKNAELNIYTWNNDTWLSVEKYNASKKAQEYLGAVKDYYTSALPPTEKDYYADNENYITPNVP